MGSPLLLPRLLIIDVLSLMTLGEWKKSLICCKLLLDLVSTKVLVRDGRGRV